MSHWLDDALVAVPYAQFLGVRLIWQDAAPIGLLPYREELIGVPTPPALHGGVSLAFLEVTALATLMQATAGQMAETTGAQPLEWPRTIDLSVDYLRPGLQLDAYARARITRAGRRYATLSVAAWQEDESRPFAQAIGHFLMPEV